MIEGDHMWTHDSDESVKSALNTRYVRTYILLFNVHTHVHMHMYVLTQEFDFKY